MRARDFVTERKRTWGIGDITLHFEDFDEADPPKRNYHRHLRQIERGVSDQERDAILKQLPMVRRPMLEFTRGQEFWLYDPKLDKAVGLKVLDRKSKQYEVKTVLGKKPWRDDYMLTVPGVDPESLQETIDPYRLDRLDPQTRRALLRMADHSQPGSWLSASEAYAMQLGLQYKNRDPQGWEQGVQHLVDTYRQYATVLEGEVVQGYFNQQQRDQAQWEQDRDEYLQQQDRLDSVLKRLAAFWYNNDEDPAVERRLAQMGWEIGQDEGYEDEPGVFVVQQGDEHGRTYRSFTAQELQQLSEESLAEIDRRGFLRGLGAAALAGVGGQALARAPAKYEYVKVQPGDTVYSIARAFGTTPQEIQRLNRLGPNFQIEVNQELKIPVPQNLRTIEPGSKPAAPQAQTKSAAKTPDTNKKPAAAATGKAAKPTKNINVNRTLTGTRGEALVTQAAAKAGIRKRSELAALLAQTAHESHDFRVMGEDLSYSAQGLMKTFPSAFPTARIASQYANRPQAIANRAYANRNGNGDEASGDGWRYRGRGYIQLTGRENYRRAGQALGLPLEKQPDIASQPEIAAQIAVWYWKNRTKPNVRNFYDTRRVTATINPAQAGARDRAENFADFYQYLGKRDVRI